MRTAWLAGVVAVAVGCGSAPADQAGLFGGAAGSPDSDGGTQDEALTGDDGGNPEAGDEPESAACDPVQACAAAHLECGPSPCGFGDCGACAQQEICNDNSAPGLCGPNCVNKWASICTQNGKPDGYGFDSACVHPPQRGGSIVGCEVLTLAMNKIIWCCPL